MAAVVISGRYAKGWQAWPYGNVVGECAECGGRIIGGNQFYELVNEPMLPDVVCHRRCAWMWVVERRKDGCYIPW